MKKSFPYEMLAATLALFGAAFLVAVYFPLLNPGLFKIESHNRDAPIAWYIFGTPIALLILCLSWFYNRKAQKLKRGEEAKHHRKPPP